MKLRLKNVLLVILIGFTLPTLSFAQSEADPHGSYNQWSMQKIRKEDQMFKKALWFRMDLRTKQNYPFFAEGNEISALLIDAVKMGVVRPFKNDSLTSRMPLDDFLENLRLPGEDDDDGFLTEKFDENDDVWKEDSKAADTDQPDEYLPRQLYVLEVKEDLVFDKMRSRMYEDILSISIIIPGEQTKIGVDKVVATFSYKELVEKVFRNNPDAIWFNARNSAEHRNLEDAFTLRLWQGTLVKYENPQNGTLVDMYNGGKAALSAAEQAIYKLIEYEATLWEY